MSGNSIGKLFSVSTFGESHGKALGCIVDGCPPGIEITEEEIQFELDRRKPGTSKYTTQTHSTLNHVKKSLAIWGHYNQHLPSLQILWEWSPLQCDCRCSR